MNVDSFAVRQKRRVVEKYRDPKAWLKIDENARTELVDDIAALPSARREGPEGAKRFDLLIYELTLALLEGSKSYDTLRKRLWSGMAMQRAGRAIIGTDGYAHRTGQVRLVLLRLLRAAGDIVGLLADGGRGVKIEVLPGNRTVA